MFLRPLRTCAEYLFLAGLLVVLGSGPMPAGSEPEPKPHATAQFSAEQVTFFENEVLPILQATCFKCHGGEKLRGGLRLSTRETILKGGDTGAAVSLDKPAESLLLKAINYKDGLEMPPTGKLPQEKIGILTRWVRAGLPWSPKAETATGTASKASSSVAAGKDYWAYKPVRRLEPPVGRDHSRVRNPIDAFILAKLEEKGLSANPPANRVALARRAYFDLIGLPPTPEQVDAFVRDDDPRAYEKLIDTLLASPHYGEKWGRHWLDLVRFAETNGYERDGPKPYAWRYRDYVIQSFNDDKPYDLFVREQLAGDELAIQRENDQRAWAEAIIATGYYRLGLWDDEPVDSLQARYDELDDIVATTAQVFLGMTMNCARCHDHKIDPLSQKDYYQLVAFFQDIPHFSDTRDVRSRGNLTDISPPETRARNALEIKQRDARQAELVAGMTKLEDEAIKKMPAEDQRAAEGPDRPEVVKKVPKFLPPDQLAEYTRLRSQLEQMRKRRGPEREQAGEMALSVNNCLVNPTATHVLIRGNPHVPGTAVEPAFPAIISTQPPRMPTPDQGAKTSGRRRVLADWIVSPDNPLLARVLVNRLWQHHFGRGIVASTNDFGKFGVLPTHPELLDWLADEFVRSGWKLKPMHKLLMMSGSYQMSSRGDPDGLRLDPGNTLFWRFNMRRLLAEEVRDSILAVSGRLNPKMGGPSIHPPIPREVLAGQSMPGQGWGKSPPDDSSRRSVYVHIKRSLLVPILAQHDQADTDSSCPVRYTTTVPTQALGMLNGEFTNEQATALAERLEKEAPGDLVAQVGRALRLTTGRVAAPQEVHKDIALIRDLQRKAQLDDTKALRQYCLMVLNTNEFIYLD